jgi:hypothetical protein
MREIAKTTKSAITVSFYAVLLFNPLLETLFIA